MALVVKDRVRVSSVTTGTGPLTLGVAITGFQDFSVIGNGNTTYYTIVDPTTGDWEVGIGTYSSTGPSLARNTILESSTGGTAVNFAANPKDVFVTYPAERSVYTDGTAISPATASRLGFTNLTQGAALSVLGVTGNATADVASIAAATDHQVLRRSGTAVAFGAVALNQSAAVTGTLPIGNGGTGLTTTPANGALDIGNGTGFTRTTLTAGTGVTVTNGAGSISIAAVNNGTVTSVASGNGMNFTTITGSGSVTMGTPSTLTTSTTNATTATSHTHAITTASANTVSTIVARDASGNFSADTITAALSGNASTATALQTARTINGTSFNGTANITTATWGTARTINGVSVNGSANYVLEPFVENDDTTNATRYITFVDSSTAGYQRLNEDANLTYNPGTNVLTAGTFSGALSGNATTATTLQTARTINGVSFNGSANITITANTTNTLTRGTYLTGANFNGSAATTWAVDATTTNTASKVVARDASGNFSAGTITASLSGNATTATSATTATTATNATNVAVTTSATASAFKVPFANTTASTTGNYGLLQDSTATFTYNPSTNVLTVGTVSGVLSGNATTATTLQTARTINGTSFNGSANITTATWGTARNINGVSVNGSTNYTVEPYVEDDDSTNATRYLTFVDNSTAGFKRLNEDSSLTYNPGTNELTSGAVNASNGIVVNSATVTADYTIPVGSNAMSAGPIEVDDGVTVTVSAGSVWTVI